MQAARGRPAGVEHRAGIRCDIDAHIAVNQVHGVLHANLLVSRLNEYCKTSGLGCPAAPAHMWAWIFILEAKGFGSSELQEQELQRDPKTVIITRWSLRTSTAKKFKAQCLPWEASFNLLDIVQIHLEQGTLMNLLQGAFLRGLVCF